jgi:hypothetical protein
MYMHILIIINSFLLFRIIANVFIFGKDKWKIDLSRSVFTSAQIYLDLILINNLELVLGQLKI